MGANRQIDIRVDARSNRSGSEFRYVLWVSDYHPTLPRSLTRIGKANKGRGIIVMPSTS